MRILLLNPPSSKMQARDYYCSASSKADYYWQPIDLLVLSGRLAEKHEVIVLDATVLKLAFEKTAEKIEKIRPDAIFFLISTPTLKDDMRLMKAVKESIGCKMYGSGNYFYFMPDKSMKDYPFLDGILMDFTSPHVFRLLDKNKKGIKDAVYRENGRVIKTAADSKKTFSYPIPKHELFPNKLYRIPHAKNFPITTMLTNFGCPFKCKFCFCSRIPFKFREIDNVIDELRYVKKLGIRDVYFRDYTFTINRAYVKELCRRMIEERFNLGWVCLSRAELVDEELLILMKRAGCHTIQFGVESGSDAILKRYAKMVDKDKIRNAFRICSKLGINTLAHFILGLPGETKKDVEKTIDFAKELKCDFASFNLYAPLIGSETRDEVIEKGWLKEKDLSFSDVSDEHLAVETPWLARKELLKLKKKAIISFYARPGYILKMAKKAGSPRLLAEYAKNGLALFKETLFGK